MTEQTIVLPYRRVSPLHIPRRDLVLSAADCLLLRVTVVESDDPAAQAMELTGGLGGPAVRLFIFAECGGSDDYGAARVSPASVLWAGSGVAADDAVGSFDIDVRAGAFAAFPLRCGWSIQLDWDGGTHAEQLASGTLNVLRSGQITQPPIFIMPDTDDVFVLA